VRRSLGQISPSPGLKGGVVLGLTALAAIGAVVLVTMYPQKRK
jgi:hypothetical protein